MLPGDSAAPPEQVAQLVQYAAFLAGNGGWLTTAVIAVLAAGSVFCVLTIVDWSRQRWGLIMPVMMLICGVILGVLAFILFDAFSALQELNLFWRGLSVSAAERALLDAAMGSLTSIGAWVVGGVSGALVFCTLGVTALIRRWRAARSKRRPPAEHPEWQD